MHRAYYTCSSRPTFTSYRFRYWWALVAFAILLSPHKHISYMLASNPSAPPEVVVPYPIPSF